MLQARGGRPRDAQLHALILEATRELLAVSSYGELSMDSIAAHAHVGKKTLYRRWPSKAPLVAEAVLDAYGRGGSFTAPDTGDIRADLRAWLVEHAEFIADPPNTALIRALIAAAAASPADNEALYEQLSVPQHAGLIARLRRAVDDGHLQCRRRSRRDRQRPHRHPAASGVDTHSPKGRDHERIRRTPRRDLRRRRR